MVTLGDTLTQLESSRGQQISGLVHQQLCLGGCTHTLQAVTNVEAVLHRESQVVIVPTVLNDVTLQSVSRTAGAAGGANW